MITFDELKEIGKIKGIENIGYMEKDYLIELILFSISKNTGNELIFNGGTALYKFHKLPRFSEDIDFSLNGDIKINVLLEKIIKDLNKFGIESEINEKKKIKNSFLCSISSKAFLYSGNQISKSNVRIDINLKSDIKHDPELKHYSSIYPDIPPFSILLMDIKEILAEKIRASLTREKARDIYDIWFLLKKGISCDYELIDKKMHYYDRKWNKKDFLESIIIKEDAWKNELKPLLKEIPNLNEVVEFISKNI